MAWVYYLLMLIVSVVGLFLTILGLPGLWLLTLGYAFYAMATGWNVYVGWPSLGALLVLAFIAEIVEFLAGAAGSKAAGGRARGMIGAVMGALVGGILGTFIPIPIVGTILGVCAGAFAGATIFELSDRELAHSLRVGWGAAKGRFWGVVSKIAFGVLMLLIALFAGLPIGKTKPAAPSIPVPAMITPTTMPTTQ